ELARQHGVRVMRAGGKGIGARKGLSVSQSNEDKGIDLIISDVAPTTSGIKFQDYTASLELCNRTLNIALNILNKGGILILKIFQGKDIELFNKQVKKRFLNFNLYKPKSSRTESKEIFIIAKFFK
ncbi:MAG: Ribosomal RNA large subunit methyltransferase E, partial [Alphaproteobacteria bacterium MarineAlpha6_Bin2]